MSQVHPQRGGGFWRAMGSLAAVAVAAGLITVLIMFLSGWFEEKIPTRLAKPAEAPGELGATVEVKLVKKPRVESAVGTVRPVTEAAVASKILARVEEVKVKAGQVVKQGDLLIKLDDADLVSRLRQAEASAESANAKLDQARIDVRRSRELRKAESITQSELDLAETALKTASAEADRARRTIEEAKVAQSYALVKAPMGGRVIDKKVNAGDTVLPGQPLLTMYDPSHMQLVATVRESLAMNLAPGQEIHARLDTFDYECNAAISEIVPEAAAESRSFQVKVTGPCPPNVYSGMFGRIFIPLADEEVLLVPRAAVARVGQLDEVEVVDQGRATRRFVRLGREFADGVEVLAGLVAGERVVERPAAESRKDAR